MWVNLKKQTEREERKDQNRWEKDGIAKRLVIVRVSIMRLL
jgi:hypothetical protein